MTERVDRASKVPGWMTVNELTWLEKISSGKSLAIEFGSWRGRSSVALAAADRVVCVDTFVDQPQETGTGVDLMDDFLAAVDGENVTPLRGSLSDEEFVDALIEEFQSSAEVVFIDASHDETSVRRDIGIAMQLVKPGGVICGHDYSSAWPGVVAAVNDLLPKATSVADSIWWCST